MRNIVKVEWDREISCRAWEMGAGAVPDRDVSTLNEMMNYQYAKIIACSAFGCVDGVEAKKKHYGTIKNTFRELSSWRLSPICRKEVY